MKKTIVFVILFFLLIVSGGCSEKEGSNEWIATELAGIENPGFNIVSKNKTKNGVSFVLADVDIEMVNEFIGDLYNHPDFTIDINYNYGIESYSYAAFNNQNESVHFTYHLEDRSGYFIYAKAGDSVFKPGVRDMGYMVKADYDYISTADETEYVASLFYSIALNIMFTNQTEQLISFVLKDFQFKSSSSLGVLSFRLHPFNDPIENFIKTGTGIYDLNFFVVQKNIGRYPTTTSYGHTSTLFDVMGIGQSSLDFVITLTAEIETTMGRYTHDYEIKVMPSGSDVTEMNLSMTTFHWTKRIDEGIPFIKVG